MRSRARWSKVLGNHTRRCSEENPSVPNTIRTANVQRGKPKNTKHILHALVDNNDSTSTQSKIAKQLAMGHPGCSKESRSAPNTFHMLSSIITIQNHNSTKKSTKSTSVLCREANIGTQSNSSGLSGRNPRRAKTLHAPGVALRGRSGGARGNTRGRSGDHLGTRRGGTPQDAGEALGDSLYETVCVFMVKSTMRCCYDYAAFPTATVYDTNMNESVLGH